MYRNAEQAYEQSGKVTGSGRDLEAAALFRAARMLEACIKEWDSGGRGQRLSEALHANMRLWTFFQVQLTRPDCGLPTELRQELLRLSAFVDRRTFELMAHPAADRLQVLIDINRQVAQGLTAEAA